MQWSLDCAKCFCICWVPALLWNRSLYDLRKFSFTNSKVNIWNSLPNAIVDVNSVEVFKSRLDNFWKFQDVKIDYTADLTGTRDRSEFDT